MKKLLTVICLFMMAVMLPVLAHAMTQAEWDQQCRMKTSTSVTLYRKVATGTDIEWQEVTTLSKGTYVNRPSYDDTLDMWEVGYFNGSGESRAYAKTNAFATAVVSIHFDDGDSCPVPEALLKDQAALFKYLAQEYPGYTFSAVSGSTMYHKHKGSSENNSNEWHSTQQDAKNNASKLNVDESALPKAVIYAPRTGEASLRQKAAGNGKVIEKLKERTIVSIVKEGKRFTQVLVNGLTGYIINGALQMIDPEQEPIGEGVLTYEGRENAGTTVNVRSEPSGKARKVNEWKTGTTVIVWSLSEDEGWYEVEYDGMRAYVQADFLTMTEIYGEEEPEEAVEDAEGYDENEAENDNTNNG